MRVAAGTLLLLIYASAALVPSALHACSTPVFRYALERWQPDNYQVVILHRDPLTEVQNRQLELLHQAARHDSAPANMTVRTIDLSQSLESEDQQIVNATGPPEQLPWILVLYPRFTDTDQLAFSGPLNTETVRALIDSPVRRQVVERIVAGDSVVWILVESGDKSKDDAAEQILLKRLGHLETTLELPGPVVGGIDALVPSEEQASEPTDSNTTADLSLRLTWIRVGRDDLDEQAFVSMLIHSESDLHEFSEPIAIPIFGQGRSHYALVGKGINDDNIGYSCQFLCGACSCEVKAQNPGADMLIQANWESLAANGRADEEPLPSLTGLGALEESVQQAAVETGRVSPAPTPDELPERVGATATPPPAADAIATYGSPIFLSAIAIVTLGFVVVAVGTILIKSRQAEG